MENNIRIHFQSTLSTNELYILSQEMCSFLIQTQGEKEKKNKRAIW